MTSAGRVLGAAVALFGAGCTGTGWAGHASEGAPARAYAPAPPARPAAVPARCPMAVPYTAVAAEDTPDGAAIAFTTAEPQEVPPLRESVRAMAARLAARPATATAGAPISSAAPPPVRAAVEEIDGGARVTLTPEHPADLDRIRASVRDRTDRMSRTGACDAGA